MRKVELSRILLPLLLGALLVGVWLGLVGSISLEVIAGERFVPFHPSEGLLTLATFLMLGGVALMSIEVAALVEALSHRS